MLVSHSPIPQEANPVRQVDPHELFEQVAIVFGAEAVQVVPQPPQLFGSALVSDSQPLRGFASQSENPTIQVYTH